MSGNIYLEEAGDELAISSGGSLLKFLRLIFKMVEAIHSARTSWNDPMLVFLCSQMGSGWVCCTLMENNSRIMLNRFNRLGYVD